MTVLATLALCALLPAGPSQDSAGVSAPTRSSVEVFDLVSWSLVMTADDPVRHQDGPGSPARDPGECVLRHEGEEEEDSDDGGDELIARASPPWNDWLIMTVAPPQSRSVVSPRIRPRRSIFRC